MEDNHDMNYSTQANEIQPENQSFSFFDQGLSSKTAVSIGTIDNFHQQLQSNAAWKMKIDEIRQEPDAKVQTELKAQLPSISPSIAITRTPPLRAGVKDGQFTHTNLIQADFDNPTDTEALIKRLTADKHTRLVFRSTRLKPKAFFRVAVVSTISEHDAAFRAVEAYCTKQGYGTIDPIVKPVNSLCFISHDPKAVLKDAQPLYWEPEAQQDSSTSPPPQPTTRDSLQGALDTIPADDYEIWFRVGCALYHDGRDFEIWDRWSQTSDKYTASEMRRKWESFGKKSVRDPIGIGYIYDLAKEHGWQAVPAPPPPEIRPPEKENDAPPREPPEQTDKYPTLPVDTSIQPPIFPDYEGKHFTGAFEHLYRAYADTHALPVASIMAMGIGAVGFCAGRRILVKTDERINHPKFLNTYTLLIGRSDVTAKSETQNELDMMLKSVDPDFFNVSDVQSIEGILRVMEQEYEAYKGGEAYYFRHGYAEGTRMYVMLDEVATLFSNARRDGTKNLLYGVNKLWKCPKHEQIARAKGSQLVKYPCLSAWGNITPDQVAEYLADSDITGGVINRWMPFFVQPKWETVRGSTRDRRSLF